MASGWRVWARIANMGLILLLYAACSAAATIPTPTATPAPRICWEAQTLTTTPDDDLDPQWSPDGTQIAFVGHHEGNPEVYVLDITTRSIHNVSNMPEDDHRPIWSPDGQYLAFIHRIHPYSPDAGHLTLVETTTGAQIFSSDGTTYSARWSADSQRLLFVEDRTSFRSFEVESRTVRELFSLPASNSIHISPDGRWAMMAVRANPPIDQIGTYVIDTERGNAEQILNSNTQSHIWSPDNTRLAFTTGEFPSAITLHTYNVGTRQLQEVYRMEEDGWIYPQDWSTDNQIAWAVVTAAQREITALFVTKENHQTRELFHINHPIGEVRWSPTRDQIAFRTYAGLYIADAQTGLFHEFVQGIGTVREIIWSPDGNFIAADIQLIMGNVNGVVITDIRTGGVYIYRDDHPGYIRSQPQWSPDRHRVVFSASQAPGRADLMMLSPCIS